MVKIYWPGNHPAISPDAMIWHHPHGYMRLENGLREQWEKDEQRYKWNAPAESVSDLEERE